MKLIAVVIAVLLGGALIFEIDTGTLDSWQVAGAGIVAAALAQVVP